MSNRFRIKSLALLAVVGSALANPHREARADVVYAHTTGGRLISFDSATPGTISGNVPLTGVAGSLVGIDFRPAAPGVLVGVGNNAGVGTIYQINTATGVATSVNTGFVLNGTSFGVDVNPVSDSLRIVSNTGQNLRVSSGGAGVVNTDGALNIGGVTQTGVVAAAYTNAVAGATSTTLHVLQDSSLSADHPLTQNPPNDGDLTSPVPLTINVSQLSGFDIAGDTQAFLSWNGGNQFGTLNLTTGQAVNTGAVGGGFAGQVVGIAIPEPTSMGLSGLAAVGVLRRRRRRQAAAARPVFRPQ